jgi:ribosome-associated toxin RatA of RatAB toxin-antitoxin module
MRHRRSPTLPLLAALVASAVAGPAAAQLPAGDDWIDWARVEAGEVVFESGSVDRGTATIRLAVGVAADPDTIWAIITACEIAPEFVPHILACERIGSIADGDAELFEQTVKPAFFLPKFDHVFRLDYFPPDRIAVSHVSGPIDRLEGEWRLVERPDGQIALLHSMTVNPGFPVPRFFVRNTLERDLPGVLEEIRERAEALAAP